MAKQKKSTIIFDENSVISYEFLGASLDSKNVHLIVNTANQKKLIFCVKAKTNESGEIFIHHKKMLAYNTAENSIIKFKSKECSTMSVEDMHPCFIGPSKFIKTIEDGIKAYETAINSLNKKSDEE